jgi:hypothetical protein
MRKAGSSSPFALVDTRWFAPLAMGFFSTLLIGGAQVPDVVFGKQLTNHARCSALKLYLLLC